MSYAVLNGGCIGAKIKVAENKGKMFKVIQYTADIPDIRYLFPISPTSLCTDRLDDKKVDALLKMFCLLKNSYVFYTSAEDTKRYKKPNCGCKRYKSTNIICELQTYM